MMTITHAEFAKAFARATLGIGCVGLHGSATGYPCAMWAGRADEPLAVRRRESGAGGVADPLDALLDKHPDKQVAESSVDPRTGKTVTRWLRDVPPSARDGATVDRCGGFVDGGRAPGAVAVAGLAPAARGVMEDVACIASMRVGCDDDDNAELAEVLDFIRSGIGYCLPALAPEDHR